MKHFILLGIILFTITFSCDKREGINPCDTDYPENLAQVVTKSIVDEGTFLNINYEIISIGNSENTGLTHHGICWSSSNSNPTILDSKTDKGTTGSKGIFNISVSKSGLSTGTWYFRSYATNCAGTVYGEVLNYNIVPIPEMIYVDGGEFMMGCTPEQGGDCDSDENPAHAVKLSDYYIGKYEVTQDEWEAVMGDTPAYHSGCGDCPIEQIDWYSMIVYCNEQTEADASLGSAQRVYYKDSGLTDPWDIDDYNGNGDTGAGAVYWDGSKSGYRLPTEAEWEFAARGGSTGSPTKYAGSDVVGDVAWYSGNAGGITRDVGGKDANELDTYDMSGNVWEWVWDWYSNYSSGEYENPQGPNNGSHRVHRGGSYNNNATHCRVSNRSNYYPTARYSSFGFRLAQSSK